MEISVIGDIMLGRFVQEKYHSAKPVGGVKLSFELKVLSLESEQVRTESLELGCALESERRAAA